MDFNDWMEVVNEILMEQMSLTAWEFENTLREWYDQGLPPEVAAENLYNDWLNQTDEEYM